MCGSVSWLDPYLRRYRRSIHGFAHDRHLQALRLVITIPLSPTTLRQAFHMHLQDLHIENLRSLEKASLERLGQLNVLIGPNNSGKSAIVGAVEYLSKVIRAESVDTSTLQTARDPRRNIRLRLRFKLNKADRSRILARLAEQAGGAAGDRAKAVEATPLLRLIEYHIESIPPHRTSHMLLGLASSRRTESGLRYNARRAI